jgi:beta-galactosidase
VADEHVKVWSDRLPHALTDVFGLTYYQFTRPDDVGLILRDDLAATGDFARDELAAMHFMELLRLDGAEPLASYDHYAWETMRPSPATSSVRAAPSTWAP